MKKTKPFATKTEHTPQQRQVTPLKPKEGGKQPNSERQTTLTLPQWKSFKNGQLIADDFNELRTKSKKKFFFKKKIGKIKISSFILIF